MPDGDRFERTLRGGGWRSAYKIAAGGGTDERVAEKLARACTSLIDAENSACAILQPCKRLSNRNDADVRGRRKREPVRRFDARDGRDRKRLPIWKLCATVFARREPMLRGAGERFPNLCFRDREALRQQADRGCLKRQFFAMTRDGIASNSGRDATAQLICERDITAKLDSFIENFAQSLTTGRRARRVRIPDLQGANRPFDLGRLHEPLLVLGA